MLSVISLVRPPRAEAAPALLDVTHGRPRINVTHSRVLVFTEIDTAAVGAPERSTDRLAGEVRALGRGTAPRLGPCRASGEALSET